MDGDWVVKKVIAGIEYNTDMSIRVCMPTIPLTCGLYRHEDGGLFLSLSGEGDIILPVTVEQGELIRNSGVFDIESGV